MTPTEHQPRDLFTRRAVQVCVLLPIRGVVISITVAILYLFSVATLTAVAFLNTTLNLEEFPTTREVIWIRDRKIPSQIRWRALAQGLYPLPLVVWRRQYHRLVRLCARTVMFSLGYHKLRRRGKRLQKSDGVDIMISNHRGLIDALTLIVAIEDMPIFVSGEDLLDIPWFGTIALALDVVIIHASDRRSVRQDINEIMKYAGNRQIIMFPEGCASLGTHVRLWPHHGVFTLCPIHRMQPVSIRYEGLGEYSPSWVSSLPDLFSRTIVLMMREANNAEVMFHSRIVPPANASAVEICEMFRHRIACSLNIPLCDPKTGAYRIPRTVPY